MALSLSLCRSLTRWLYAIVELAHIWQLRQIRVAPDDNKVNVCILVVVVQNEREEEEVYGINKSIWCRMQSHTLSTRRPRLTQVWLLLLLSALGRLTD